MLDPVFIIGGIIWCIMVIGIISYSLYTFYQHWKYDHIPGPRRGSFVWGNLFQLKRARDDKQTLHWNIIVAWAAKYGTIFKFFILHRVTVVVLDPDALKDMLVSGNLPKAKTYLELSTFCEERFMGKSLMTEVDQDLWKQRRDCISPAFQERYLLTVFDKLNDGADLIINRLKAVANGTTTVKMFDEFCVYSMAILAKVLCSLDIDIKDNKEANLYKSTNLIMQAVNHSFDQLFDKFNPLKWKYRDEVSDAIIHIRGILKKMVHNRMKAKKAGIQLPSDLLTHFMQNRDIEDVVDDLVSLIMAGFETTASTLSFCLMELSKHPKVLKKLEQELHQVLGDEKTVSSSDLDRLQYLDKVIKETLRLYPVSLGTMRVLMEDKEYSNYKIPANTAIMVSMVAMGRTEWFYKNPLTFDPDRFNSKTQELPKYAHCPFGLGQRACVGEGLALMGIKLLLVRLLMVYDFTWLKDQSEDIVEHTTLKLKDKCQMTVCTKPVTDEYDLRVSQNFNSLVEDFTTGKVLTNHNVTEGNLTAPLPFGAKETVTLQISNTENNATYFFSIKARDMSGNEGDPSNVISSRIGLKTASNTITRSTSVTFATTTVTNSHTVETLHSTGRKATVTEETDVITSPPHGSDKYVLPVVLSLVVAAVIFVVIAVAAYVYRVISKSNKKVVQMASGDVELQSEYSTRQKRVVAPQNRVAPLPTV
ncbi:cholesterol 24-hydroxylase-like [Glandiceps talaboti]